MEVGKEVKSIKDKEFEKNRREILKQSKSNIKNKNASSNKNKDLDSSHRFAWEYEIEVYKEQKRKERFYIIGAWCGIISLLLTLLINYKVILELIPLK